MEEGLKSQREGKAATLRNLGFDPFPAQVDRTHTAEEVISIIAEFSDDQTSDESTKVSITGRIMARRSMGRASFFDIVDGQVARYTNKISKSGGFLDSIFDKIAEVAIFFGILIGNYTEPYLVFTAITLSLLVSYTRAKADVAGIKMQGIGIGERAERLLVIAIIGMIGFMEIAVIIVIIIATITLAQRISVLVKSR